MKFKKIAKKHPVITWILTFFIIFIFVFVFLAIIISMIATNNSNKNINVGASSLDISVTSQIVKSVDGKCRYFFDIRNNDDKDFEGSVKIELINQRGSSIWDDTFTTNRAIEPSLGTSVYTDANTCPVAIHGEYGISTYEYEVKFGNKVVKTGSGSISTKFENF